MYDVQVETDISKSPATSGHMGHADEVQQRSWALRHLPPKGVVLGKKLGQGSFGQVFKGARDGGLMGGGWDGIVLCRMSTIPWATHYHCALNEH